MTIVSRQAMADDSGLFTTGTVIDKAFVDQIYDQVDDQAHSTTNPTIKPKATTDEVVAARGSKASVDARLDVALNEDGTLKSQSSLVTAAQFESALGSRNVALNGDLDDWANGGALAPDNFTLTGAAATIARTGLAMADTFQFGTGTNGFAAKVTRVGNDWKLTQDVIAAASFTNFANVKGQKVSVAVKGKTSVASLLRIVVDDGVSTTASTYHTGGNTEEHLSATHTISASATKLSVYVEGTGSNGDAYVGGFMVVFADLAPTDWSPYSVLGDASLTSKGLVSIGAQSFAGVKTFGSVPLGLVKYARCSSPLTKNNSTVFGDVTGMAFTVAATEVWVFFGAVYATSLAAADHKFTFTGPAASTAIRFGCVGDADNAASSQSAFGSSCVTGGTDAVDKTIYISGHLRNGANAGTVQLQYAQNSANVSDSIVRAESWMIAVRIS